MEGVSFTFYMEGYPDDSVKLLGRARFVRETCGNPVVVRINLGTKRSL